MGIIKKLAIFGRQATGKRRRRQEQSPQWKRGKFRNPQPMWNNLWGALVGLLKSNPHGRPHAPVPVVTGHPERFLSPPATGLRVTWLGHSTILIEIDGHRILTDPMWGRHASPFSLTSLERFFPPPLALESLPQIDAVVISHDHYDHLDHRTILAMKDWSTTFIVPLGLGAHLVHWGVPEARIVELDWWEQAQVRGLKIVSTPARHASGRHLLDQNKKLWSGYAFIGEHHRVYFSGDTGMLPAFHDIGMKLGPFDLSMIEVGAYSRNWPDWHLGPELAVAAHLATRGRVLLPIHWGLFNMAPHGWTEPIERTLAAAKENAVTVVTPMPGESFEPETHLPHVRWWPDLPWRTGMEDPIIPTTTGPSKTN